MMELSKGSSKRRLIQISFAAVVFLCINSLAGFYLKNTAHGQTENVGLAQAEAKRREGKVQVVSERGTVESAATVELRAFAASTISYLAKVGTAVKAGDVLVELDPSDIQNEFDTQRIKLQSAKAKSVSAAAFVESFKIQRETALIVAKQANKVAKLRLDTFLGKNGESATKLADLHDQLVAFEKKKEAFASAMKRINDSTDTPAELELANIQSQIAQAHSEISITKRQLRLHETTTTLRAAELRLDLAEQNALQAATASTLRKNLNQAEAELVAAKSSVRIEKDKLKLLEDKLRNCTLRAPCDGVLLHINVPSGRRAVVGIKEGTQVRENQPIVQVADMKRLQVAILVNENQIKRVKAGKRARVQIDAFADKVLEGTVKHVSDTAEPQPVFGNNAKNYRVVVSINALPELRIGMTALVEIE